MPKASLQSAISYLKNEKYAGGTGALNIVKENGMYHLEPGQPKAPGAGKPELSAVPPKATGEYAEGAKPPGGIKMSTGAADKIYEGKIATALQTFKESNGTSSHATAFLQAKADAMAEWKANTTGMPMQSKQIAGAHLAESELYKNMTVGGMGAKEAYAQWKQDTAKEKAGTLGKPEAAGKPDPKDEYTSMAPGAKAEYVKSGEAQRGVPDKLVPDGFKQITVADMGGHTSAFEAGMGKLHESLTKSSGGTWDNKATVVAGLRAQLKDSPNFQALKAAKGDTPTTHQQNTLESNLVASWASTSGDGSSTSVAAQLAARDVFGMKDKDLSFKALSAIKSAGSEENVFRNAGVSMTGKEVDPKVVAAGMREFVAGMYRATQADLAARGVSEVYVVRGMRIMGGKKPELAEVKMQPVSAFSTNFNIAAGFTGGSNGGSLFMVKIPASQVLSTYMTGFGCTNEDEVTVLAHRDMAAVRVPRSMAYGAKDAAAKAYAHLGPKGTSNVTEAA